MDALGSNDQQVLERMEEIIGDEMPTFVRTREEVYDFLLYTMRETLHA